MGRVTHGKRNVPVNHKPNSWKGRVFYQLKTLVKTMRGTPSTFALVISQRLGGVVSRQLVWDLLNNHNFTKKQQSTVPGHSVPVPRVLGFTRMSRYRHALVRLRSGRRTRNSLEAASHALDFARAGQSDTLHAHRWCSCPSTNLVLLPCS